MKKYKNIINLPIGSEWATNNGIEGILLDICEGSADVIITKSKKDFQNDNTIPQGRLRISNHTQVKERKQ